MTADLCRLTAIELRNRIGRGELSAREVMAAHLAQIERVNPGLNAIVTLVADQAMTGAAAADERQARGEPLGLLHGLPVAHKDLFDTKGIRTTYGSPLYAKQVPTTDALIVERLKAAGAISVGKTNTPEWGAGSPDVQPDLRGDPQSLRPLENLRRVERRLGGGAGGGHGADGRWQ